MEQREAHFAPNGMNIFAKFHRQLSVWNKQFWFCFRSRCLFLALFLQVSSWDCIDWKRRLWLCSAVIWNPEDRKVGWEGVKSDANVGKPTLEGGLLGVDLFAIEFVFNRNVMTARSSGVTFTAHNKPKKRLGIPNLKKCVTAALGWVHFYCKYKKVYWMCFQGVEAEAGCARCIKSNRKSSCLFP